MSRAGRTIGAAVLLVIFAGMLGGVPGTAQTKKATLSQQYTKLLNEADALWADYKKADTSYHEKGKTSLNAHVKKLADIQDRLTALHTKWSQFEVSDEMFVTDMKVGLALELQMGAISSEIIGLEDEDQTFLDMSENLDKKYAKVVDSM
jgi:hypothetical protein